MMKTVLTTNMLTCPIQIFRNVELVDKEELAKFIVNTSKPGIPPEGDQSGHCSMTLPEGSGGARVICIDIVANLQKALDYINDKFNKNEPLFRPV